MNNWWDTPSCKKFLERISSEIWGGKISLVFLPRHAPDGFLSSLKPVIGNGNNIRYEKFNLSEASESDVRPFESLVYEHFELGNRDPIVLKKVSDIFSKISNDQYKVFVFENLPFHLTQKFIEFVIDAGRFFTSQQVQNRAKFLALLDPEKISPLEFPPEPGIERFNFRGILKNLDQLMGIYYLYPTEAQKLNSFTENLICSISQYDFIPAGKLLSCSDILEGYHGILLDYANERCWEKVKYKPVNELKEKELWSLWASGIIDEFNGKTVYHSAYYAVHKQQKELDKKIWLAGVKALLPLIEEFRQLFINSEKVVFPFKFLNQKNGEIIEDKNEFEIGDLWYMVKNGEITFKWIPSNEKPVVIEFLNICRELRNDLSHVKIPSSQSIKKFFHNMEKVEKILNGKFS